MDFILTWILTPATARKSILNFLGLSKSKDRIDNAVAHCSRFFYLNYSSIKNTVSYNMSSRGVSEGGGRTLFGRKISSLLKSMDMKTCEPEIAVGLLR